MTIAWSTFLPTLYAGFGSLVAIFGSPGVTELFKERQAKAEEKRRIAAETREQERKCKDERRQQQDKIRQHKDGLILLREQFRGECQLNQIERATRAARLESICQIHARNAFA